MKPIQIDNRQEDIFRGRLSNELNPKHEMMMLSRLIPWDSLEVELALIFTSPCAMLAVNRQGQFA